MVLHQIEKLPHSTLGFFWGEGVYQMLFFLITREQKNTESGLDVARDGGLC